MNRKTLVLGASPNPSRYSHMAMLSLIRHGNDVVALGKRQGNINGIQIMLEPELFKDIHTITIYMNAENQKPFIDYILSLEPKRIIFNPGAENSKLERMATEKGIETLNACTLVMLSTGQY